LKKQETYTRKMTEMEEKVRAKDKNRKTQMEADDEAASMTMNNQKKKEVSQGNFLDNIKAFNVE